MKIASLITIASLLAVPAAAAETEWVEVAPDVTVRLVSSDIVTQQGTVWMGLEVDMPITTKTYWRVPGESGLPLVIDTQGSHQVEHLEVAWPYPTRDTQDGYLDHAFYGHVIIPFEIAINGDDPMLIADITMGICSDVCVPANASFTLAPDLTKRDSASDLRIRQALAGVPLPHDGADLLGAAVLDNGTGSIAVRLEDKDFDATSMIAEIVGSPLLFGEPEISGDGNELSFPLLGRIDENIPGDIQARFTFNTADGPYEIIRPLAVE